MSTPGSRSQTTVTPRTEGLRGPATIVLLLSLLLQAGSVSALQQAIVRRTADSPRYFADDRLAVVVYAPAQFAKQLKCEALVESIRSQGLWGGRLYLITEQLKCYQHERWMQCGLDADIIALDDSQAAGSVLQQQHSHSVWWRMMFGPMWEAFKSQLVRARLWQLLQPPAPVEAILYIHGCEMLVGAPLEPFVKDALGQFHRPDPPMVVLVPTEPSDSQQQQQQQAAFGAAPAAGLGGAPAVVRKAGPSALPAGLEGSGSMWVVHRDASAKLLEAWQQEVMIGAGATNDDGQLLSDAVLRAGGEACASPDAWRGCLDRYVATTTGYYARSLRCDPVRGCGGSLAPAVFNYVPDSVCASTDHEMVSDWVGSLDLCVYQDLGYCVPRLMHAFAQSWLPYPQCGKLELGLSRLACQWSCTEPSVMRSPGFRTSVTARPLTLH